MLRETNALRETPEPQAEALDTAPLDPEQKRLIEFERILNSPSGRMGRTVREELALKLGVDPAGVTAQFASNHQRAFDGIWTPNTRRPKIRTTQRAETVEPKPLRGVRATLIIMDECEKRLGSAELPANVERVPKFFTTTDGHQSVSSGIQSDSSVPALGAGDSADVSDIGASGGSGGSGGEVEEGSAGSEGRNQRGEEAGVGLGVRRCCMVLVQFVHRSWLRLWLRP